MKKLSKQKKIELSIIIVTYNSERDIEKCINSIEHQAYKPFEIILVDNNSQDKTLNIVEQHPSIHLVKNSSNLGFSKANNQAIELSKGKYILLLNPDVQITKYFISKLIQAISHNPRTAFVSPKLLKPSEKMVLDSTGVLATNYRWFFDRGRGETDQGSYDARPNIFSATGAAVLFKKEALQSVKLHEEYFDEDFLNYLEDIDLCWRMRLKGWEGLYCSEAIAYHARGHDLKSFDRQNIFSFIKQRLHQNKKNKHFKHIRSCVFRNNIFVLIKNESFYELLRNFFPFTFFWIKRIGYAILLEPYVFRDLPYLLGKLPTIAKKRSIIQKTKTIQHKDLRSFFTNETINHHR